MNKVKVLVVEDEWITAQDIKKTLEKLDYLVPVTVATGEEAIQKAIELQPNLVLMDIVLPGEIDGIEAADKIYKSCNIPIVFLTAYSDRETFRRASIAQPFGYVLKPFEDQELNTTIQIALSRHKSTVELQGQLAAIVESSEDAIIANTLEGIIATWNAGAEKIFGYSASEAIARPISMLMPPNSADDIPQKLEKVNRGEKIDYYETVRMRKDGQLIDVSVTFSPIKDAMGTVIGAAKIARDITQRKRNERIIEHQKSLLTSLIEGTTDLIAALDQNFRFITFNKAYKAELIKIFDREIEIGSSLIEAIAHLPEEQAKAVEIWKRALAGEEFTEIREFKDINRERHYYEITCSSIREQNGRLVGAAQIVKNVSDRIRAEQVLRESEERFRNAFEYTAVGMALTALDGHFLKVNRSFCQMMSYSEAELLTMNFQSLTHPDDLNLSLSHMQQLLAGEVDYFQMEKRYLHKQGHTVWAIVSASLVRDERGQPLYFIAQTQDITQRKRTEAALQQSEARYRGIVEDQTELVNRYLPDGTLTFVNEAFCRYFGGTREELLGKRYKVMVFDADREYVIQQVNSISLENPIVIIENRVVVGGEVRWTQWINRGFFDQQGSVVELQSTGRDISALKQAEQALRESEQRYRQIVETADEGIWIIDLEGNTTFANSKMAQMLGYPVEEMLGMSFFAFMDEEWKAIATQNLQRRRQTIGEKHDFKFRRKDGSDLWTIIATSVILDESGQPTGALGMIADITQRKQAEEALEQSERLFRLLAEISPVGIFRSDASGQTIYTNNRACQIVGRTLEEVLGLGWGSCVHPEDASRVYQSWQYSITHQVPWQEEYRLLHREGKAVWVLSQAEVERDETGKVVGYVGTLTDISDRKLAELEILRSRDLREAIFNESADALFLVEPETQTTFDCNSRAVQLFEANSKDELINLSGNTLQRQPFTPEDLLAIAEEMNTKNCWSREIEYVTKKGNFFWGNLAATRINIANRAISLVRITDITERKATEKTLELQAVIMRNMAEGICLVKATDWTIVYANSKLETMFGYDAGELNGKPASVLNYNDENTSAEDTLKEIIRKVESEGAASCEMHNVKKDGTQFWCQGTISQFEHPDYGKVYVGVQHDITEQKHAQDQIKLSLKEKEVLLKEIHHRVKNNLQIIKSLLHLQSKRTKQQEALFVLQDSQNRIVSIALIHEKLYRSENLANINFGQYIRELAVHLFNTYNINSSVINLNIETDNIFLEIDTAIPCGLIVNELVSNTLKYAFPNRRKGELQVQFRTNTDGTMTLIVRDNGIGIPEEFDIKKTSSLGLTLVQRLVGQLDGTLELDRSQGTEFRITLPGTK